MYTPNLVSILFYDPRLSIFKFDDVMPTSRIENYPTSLAHNSVFIGPNGSKFGTETFYIVSQATLKFGGNKL